MINWTLFYIIIYSTLTLFYSNSLIFFFVYFDSHDSLSLYTVCYNLIKLKASFEQIYRFSILLKCYTLHPIILSDIWYYIRSHHIAIHHIISHYIASHHITSHHMTPQHITSQHSLSQHSTVQHIILHHITAELSTVHRSTAQQSRVE